MNRRKLFIHGLLGVIVSLGVVVTAQASSRYRGLERLLEDTRFTESEKEGLTEAYGAALKSGLDRSDARALVKTCLEGEFGAAGIERVLFLLGQIELSGLPPESFISKIEEGISKRVPAETIMKVAEQRALSLKRAANILNDIILGGHDVGDRDELSPAVATALEAGKDEGGIRRMIIDLLEEGESIRRIKVRLLR